MTEATQTGVAMAAIGMIGTVVGLIVGVVKDRDKLKYDKKITDQDAKIAVLTIQNTQQAAEMVSLRHQHTECVEQHKTVEAELVQIRLSLAGKKDDTTTHHSIP